MVALYWLLNRLLTYWFIRDVFPTLQVQRMGQLGAKRPPRKTGGTHPESPRMMTCAGVPDGQSAVCRARISRSHLEQDLAPRSHREEVCVGAGALVRWDKRASGERVQSV
jgi:hypothetical protein